VRYANDVAETEPPRREELEVLRELHARTAKAHGTQAA
jgi:glutaconate CoA-transferase subunit B